MNECQTKDNVIPIVFCFNDKFSIPGAVTMFSILKRSDRSFKYNFYVLHSGISEKHQKLLSKVVSRFNNASLSFMDMKDRFETIFSKMQGQTCSHWGKEVFYKCSLSSLFPQYERIIVSDVDVLFMDDILPLWNEFLKDNENYLGGFTGFAKKTNSVAIPKENVTGIWSAGELNKVYTGGGFWFQNLKLMRENSIEQKILAFIEENKWRLTQNEQQAVNMVCWPKIKLMHPRGMVCTWHYDNFKDKLECLKEVHYSPEIVWNSLMNPVQLHYAGVYKPWNAVFTTKSILWWKELFSICSAALVFECIGDCVKDRVYLKKFRDDFRKNLQHSSFLQFVYSIYKKMKK